jgi:hypothetical protein
MSAKVARRQEADIDPLERVSRYVVVLRTVQRASRRDLLQKAVVAGVSGMGGYVVVLGVCSVSDMGDVVVAQALTLLRSRSHFWRRAEKNEA